MTVRFMCNACQTRIKVPDEFGGRKVKCPKCDITQVAPRQTPVMAPSTAPASSAGRAANDMTGVWEFDPNQTANDLDALAAASYRGNLPQESNPANSDSGQMTGVDTANRGVAGDTTDAASPGQSPSQETGALADVVGEIGRGDNGNGAGQGQPSPQPKVIPKNKLDRGSEKPGGAAARVGKVRSMPTPKPAGSPIAEKRRQSAKPDQTTSSILSANWPREQRPHTPRMSTAASGAAMPQGAPAEAPAFRSLQIVTWLLRGLAILAVLGTLLQMQRLSTIEAASEDRFLWLIRGLGAAVGVWAFAEICNAMRHIARRG